MTPPRFALVLAAAAVAALGVLLGGVLRPDAVAQPGALAPAGTDAFATGFSLGQSTETTVEQLQSRLRAVPDDQRSLALLGLAYEQRARETADPAWYPKADGVLRRAATLDPRDPVAVVGLGQLALARHRFRDALALGERARSLSPTTASVRGVIGDALVELGRYDEAFRTFDEMTRLRPSLASYARVSYARELLGRSAAAERAMLLAVDAARGKAEPMAWTRTQLGKLYWSQGRVRAAGLEFRQALAVLPGYVHALDGLAQVEWALGRTAKAIALEQQAVARVPLPQFAATLGDLYAAAGKPALARRQYGLVRAIERLLVANGVRVDLETALFDADHGAPSLALARKARAERPSIDGADVLAWSLARNGRCGEALRWSTSSLRLGTRDALKLFHRGMIERCLGRDGAARATFREALALNPHFSVRWSATARRLAR